ncbi:MAG: hypothetical protein AAF806_28845 [Bacteroidota bacterium]
MTNTAKNLDSQQLDQAIDQTLINLRVSFTPNEWTTEKRQEIKEDLNEVEDLAKAILSRRSSMYQPSTRERD